MDFYLKNKIKVFKFRDYNNTAKEQENFNVLF